VRERKERASQRAKRANKRASERARPLTHPLLSPPLPFHPQAARAIGAVNTLSLLPRAGGGVRVRGDNTDWLGVFWPLRRAIAARAEQREGAGGSGRAGSGGGGGGGVSGARVPSLVVVGAGATSQAVAFAARRLGLRLLVANRTRARAEELARAWGGAAVGWPGLSEGEGEGEGGGMGEGELGRCEVVALVCTLPAAAAWTAPAALLARDAPAVLDAAYRPRETPLLAQARAAGCEVCEGVGERGAARRCAALRDAGDGARARAPSPNPQSACRPSAPLPQRCSLRRASPPSPSGPASRRRARRRRAPRRGRPSPRWRAPCTRRSRRGRACREEEGCSGSWPRGFGAARGAWRQPLRRGKAGKKMARRPFI